MYYSLIGLLAFMLLIITNYDVLLKRKDTLGTPEIKIYRRFLMAVIVYYITDILWGMLETLMLPKLLYVDTEIYFVAMAAGILFWTKYVAVYLEGSGRFRKFLTWAGNIFFVAVVLLVVVNLFYPVLFFFDEAGGYHEGPARNIGLIVQILVLLLTSVYALRISFQSRGTGKNRHFTVGIFGIIMLVFISIQYFEPYLPLYSIGYMLGCSLHHTFVIENEKEDYRRSLEAALAREKRDLQELNAARELAYTDTLTGAGSRLAYAEKEDQMDKAIYAGTAGAMAIVVFDLNGLKKINDTEGHDAGDQMIIGGYRLIRDIFRNSPVYRLGGDEFITVLEGVDYENREQLVAEFNRKIDENKKNNGVIIAAGIADYTPDIDTAVKHIFKRADSRMYQRKSELKA